MNQGHRLRKGTRGPTFSGRWIRASWRYWGQIFLLTVMLFVPTPSPLHSQVSRGANPTEYDEAQRTDQYFIEKQRQQARERQEKFRTQVAIPDAMGDEVPTLAALEAASQEVTVTRNASVVPFWLRWLMILGVFVLVGFLAVLRFFPEAVERFREQLAPWDAWRSDTKLETGDVRTESQAFAEFIAAFRTGPVARSDVVAAQPPLEAFLAGWPRVLGDLRKQLKEVGLASDSRIRRRFLRDLGRELRQVKGETGMPELLPAWQMVCVLEGLIKQLAEKVNEVTPSTLRTVSGAMDLLAEMCRPGLDAQLLTRRPVRLLAVDDDPISRHAISFALKRALHAPDLAAGGEAGLVLAREHTYDVIFLDVEMPDMDGFELCTQIHKTSFNRSTPVVFVTGQSDFEARVQSTLSGGCDLIAKPFLTFELAVKALTLTMRNRLQEGKSVERGVQPAPIPAEEIAATPEAAPVTKADSVRARDDDVTASRRVPPVVETNVVKPVPSLAPGELVPAPTVDSEEIATEFLTRAPEHLSWVNEMLRNALKVTDEAAWLPMLSDVYLRLHSFTPDEKFAKGHPAMQLSSALERLLRKLLQSTTPPTKATMITVTSAVELLRDLCAQPATTACASAPVHLLVVDDDPVARRALTGALQTTFEKPVCAENGAAALELAAEKTFDVIFLDVQMPGMDGFEVFARLRSEGCNTTTPVVFVCGRTDLGTVAEISARGDCDIVAKPFLTGELLVKALTLMLRRQREQAASRT